MVDVDGVIFALVGSLIFMVFLFGSLIVWTKVNEDEAKKIKAKLEKENPGARVFISNWGDWLLVLDFEKQKIILGASNNSKKYDFADIISVDLCKNGATITSTNRGSQILGAIAGGIAFGGVGAIIGGLSGSTTSSEKIKQIAIRVTVEDVSNPSYEINFFRSPEGLPETMLRQTMKEVDERHALIVNAMRKAQKREKLSIEKSDRNTPKAQQIKELWDLFQTGAITQTEYEAEKLIVLSR